MCDRPFERWPRDDQGHIGFVNSDLDLDALLAVAPDD
jgi:hypothetical protein